jgi:hypothetical protein
MNILKILIPAAAWFVMGFTVGTNPPWLSHLLPGSSGSCPAVDSAVTKQEVFAAMQCAKNAGGYIIAQDVPANASTSIAVGGDTVLISIDGDGVTSILRPLREGEQIQSKWVPTKLHDGRSAWIQEFESAPSKNH